MSWLMISSGIIQPLTKLGITVFFGIRQANIYYMVILWQIQALDILIFCGSIMHNLDHLLE